MRRLLPLALTLAAFAACSQPATLTDGAKPADTSTAASPALGVKPLGDTEVAPDMSQVPPDLAKVFDHIDENVDAHVVNLQK